MISKTMIEELEQNLDEQSIPTPCTKILDRDATWKILHTPVSNVISYLLSLPRTAEIIEDYKGEGNIMELIVVQH